MSYALPNNGAWREVRPGMPIVTDLLQVSYGGFLAWSDAEKRNFVGALPIPAPVTPEGKIEVSRALGGDEAGPAWVVTYVDVAPPSPPAVPETISDRQFAQALAKQGVITQGEALAFVKRGEVPDALQAVIDGVEDPDQRFDLDMAVSGATTFDRSNPSTEALAAAMGWSAAQMDDLWRFAATIR